MTNYFLHITRGLPPEANADPRLLNIGMAAVILIAFGYLIRAAWKIMEKKRPMVVPMENTNVFYTAEYIRKKILDCWDEEQLNKWLGEIKSYEIRNHYNVNSQYQVKLLRQVFEEQQSKIWYEQLRAEGIIREMQAVK